VLTYVMAEFSQYSSHDDHKDKLISY